MARRSNYDLPAELRESVDVREKPKTLIRINPRDLPSMADYGFRPVPDTPRIRDDG
jgi:hypothetical protein